MQCLRQSIDVDEGRGNGEIARKFAGGEGGGPIRTEGGTAHGGKRDRGQGPSCSLD